MKFIKRLTESVSWDKYNDEKFQRINNDYLPDTGEGDNMAQQIVTAINKLIYKWYNDGDVYDNVMSNLEGWANDLSSYANWLHTHVPEVARILEDIEGVVAESKYEDILYKAANILFDLELLEAYEKNPKNGSIYDCEGPFEFNDDPYEDEEDEYDWGDSEEDYWDDDMYESCNKKSIKESPDKYEVLLQPYERYEKPPLIKKTFTSNSLAKVLETIADRWMYGFYPLERVDDEGLECETQEEAIAALEKEYGKTYTQILIDELERTNGDGCAFIFYLKNLTTGEMIIDSGVRPDDEEGWFGPDDEEGKVKGELKGSLIDTSKVKSTFDGTRESLINYCEAMGTTFDKLTSFNIPDSVTSISSSAFDHCTRLKSITIPDSVISIGELAFNGCKNLKSITIPDGLTSIGTLAFSGCKNLTSITIPDGLTNIGESAFNGCENLTRITIPDSVTSIGDAAFWRCKSLTIICSKGSYAEKYAKENNIPVKLTESANNKMKFKLKDKFLDESKSIKEESDILSANELADKVFTALNSCNISGYDNYIDRANDSVQLYPKGEDVSEEIIDCLKSDFVFDINRYGHIIVTDLK